MLLLVFVLPNGMTYKSTAWHSMMNITVQLLLLNRTMNIDWWQKVITNMFVFAAIVSSSTEGPTFVRMIDSLTWNSVRWINLQRVASAFLKRNFPKNRRFAAKKLPKNIYKNYTSYNKCDQKSMRKHFLFLFGSKAPRSGEKTRRVYLMRFPFEYCVFRFPDEKILGDQRSNHSKLLKNSPKNVNKKTPKTTFFWEKLQKHCMSEGYYGKCAQIP